MTFRRALFERICGSTVEPDQQRLSDELRRLEEWRFVLRDGEHVLSIVLGDRLPGS
jgi:hypothetical protein